MEKAIINFHFYDNDIAENTTIYLVDGESRKPLSSKCIGDTISVQFDQMQDLNGILVFEY